MLYSNNFNINFVSDCNPFDCPKYIVLAVENVKFTFWESKMSNVLGLTM